MESGPGPPKKRKKPSSAPKRATKPKGRRTERPQKKTDRVRDNSVKRAKRNGMEDVCVKSCFAKRFAQGCNGFVRDYLRTLVDGYVESISAMSVRASLVINETVHRSLESGTPLPDLRCLTTVRQIFEGSSQNPVVRQVVDELFYDHPDIHRWPADWQSVTYEAKQYVTIFQNSIVFNFDGRLRTFLKSFIRTYYADSPKWWWWAMYTDILEIENDHDDLPTDLDMFVADMKIRLGWTGQVDSRTRASDLILPTYQILRAHLDFDVRGGFTMSPISSVKRRYVTIDSTTLHCMASHVVAMGMSAPEWMRRVSSTDRPSFTQDYDFQDYAWKRFFDTSRLRVHAGNNTIFNHRIATDGVGVTVTFLRPKRPTPPRRKMTKAEIQRRKDEEVRLKADTHRTYERHVFVDPGRDHYITAREVVQGTPVYKSITRGQYYQSFRRGTLQLERWNRRLQEVDSQFSQTSLKTCDSDLRAAYIRVYIKNYGLLWTERGSKRHSRVRFWIMARKRRCLDVFFASFCKDDKRKPCFWYGNGSFASHGRGPRDGKAGPVKFILETCKRHYNTIMVDETLTSQMHSGCQTRMHPVCTRPSGEDDTSRHRRKVRGLYWCPTCKILVHRDRDATICIEHVAMSLERPAYLTSMPGGHSRQTLDKLPARQPPIDAA